MLNAKTLIPFGDHIGEYLEDQSIRYLKWLTNQQWFEDKFSDLFKKAEEIIEESE